MFKGKVVAFDTETTGLNAWHGDAPFAFAFCSEDGSVAYFEFEVDPMTRRPYYTERKLEKIKRILREARVVVMHHAKFDVRMMEVNCGFGFQGIDIQDTMYMAHAANSQEPSIGLKQLAKRYLDIPDQDLEDLTKAVHSCRRKAAKLGWKVGYRVSEKPDGSYEKKAQVPSDYWLPRAIWLHDASLIEEKWYRLCKAYAIQDVVRTLALYQFLDAALDETEGARHAYAAEMALWWTTYRMETRGVRVDAAEIDRQVASLRQRRTEHLEHLDTAARKVLKRKDAFNPQSNAQIAKLLEALNLKITERTKTGLPKVDLESLYQHIKNPVIQDLLAYKAATSGLSSFMLRYKEFKLPDPLSKKAWCIRPNFRQVGPKTRRYACGEPNLQNVADAFNTRSVALVQARTPFGPRPGYAWYHYDYEQLESRIYADIADETFMLTAFRTGRDLHTECTNKIWGGEGNPSAVHAAIRTLELDASTGLDPSKDLLKVWRQLGVTLRNQSRILPSKMYEIGESWLASFDYNIVAAEKSLHKKNWRAKAKLILFGKLFGIGPQGAMGLLEATLEEAKQFLGDYDTAFPNINRFMRRFSRAAGERGYILNALGSRINVNPEFAYRAVNYMIQGSAASQLKRALRRCDLFLRANQIDGYIVLTIHDEIVFEIAKKEATRPVLLRLKRIMEDHGGAFPKVETPIGIDVVSRRWNEKKEMEL